jgi:hypothetical protein
MTIHISMQPAFFLFSRGFQVISGQWSCALQSFGRQVHLTQNCCFFAAAGRFFSAGMHFEIVGEDRHGRTGRSRHSMVIVMVSHGEAKWSQSPLLKSEHPSSLKEVSKRCSATKEQSLNCVVTAKVSTCLNTDSKQNVKPGDSTKTCLNSSKFYMKSMNNFNEMHPLLHHSRECTKLLPAFLHQWASEYEWHCSMGPCDDSNVQDMVFVEDQIIHTFIQLPSDKKDRLKERVRQES